MLLGTSCFLKLGRCGSQVARLGGYVARPTAANISLKSNRAYRYKADFHSCSCDPVSQRLLLTKGRLVINTSHYFTTSTSALPGLPDVQQRDDHLSITIADSPTFRASYLWLRDHCRCSVCYEETCHENFVDIVSLPADIKPKEWHCVDGNLQLTWPDDHVTTYTLEWLRDNVPGQGSDDHQLQPFLWDKGKLLGNLPEDVPLEALRDGDGLRNVMENLHVFGFTFVSGIEATREKTEEAISLVNRPMYTLYGDFFHYQNDGELNDAASLAVALKNHTDTTYFDLCAGGIVLHCLYHDGTGGENTLVDGYHAAEQLRVQNPEYYDTLLRCPVVGHYLDDTYDFRCYHTVLQQNVLTNKLQQIRFNPHDRRTLSYLSYDDADKFYAAYRALGSIIDSPESQLETKLKPGRMIIIDNWRLLHGRAAFTGKRVMAGCYFNYDYLQNLKRTKAHL